MTVFAGKVTGFQQLMLPVSDIEQSKRFYGDLLGLTAEQHDDSCVLVGVGAGSSIMLHGHDAAAPVPGSAEIWLRAEGLDALCERLRASGITVQGPSDQSWGERMAAMQDPDGYHIYVVEPLSGK